MHLPEGLVICLRPSSQLLRNHDGYSSAGHVAPSAGHCPSSTFRTLTAGVLDVGALHVTPACTCAQVREAAHSIWMGKAGAPCGCSNMLLSGHVLQRDGGGHYGSASVQAQTSCCCRLKISLDEMYNGAVRKLSLSRNIKCEPCSGSGTKSGRRYQCEVRGRSVWGMSLLATLPCSRTLQRPSCASSASCLMHKH